MMGVFPEELLAHLGAEATTICTCWRVTRADGTVLGFTDHDRRLLVDGVEHEPATGLAGSEARTSLGLGVDATDVEGALSAEAISESDIEAGRYDGATVETLMVNWRQPSSFATLRRATVGKIERRDGRFVAELESAAHALDRVQGRIIRRSCDAELGDGRCGVDLNGGGLLGSGAVLARIAPDRVRISGLGAFADGWFAHGRMTWTSGEAAGSTVAVIAHETATGSAELVLWQPVQCSAGDTFDIVAGCDKRFKTCREKFANTLNFRGFPHLPGNDAAYGYVTVGQVLDGGALVP